MTILQLDNAIQGIAVNTLSGLVYIYIKKVYKDHKNRWCLLLIGNGFGAQEEYIRSHSFLGTTMTHTEFEI